VANKTYITKDLKKETVLQFEVEDFAHFLISKHHTVATLRSKVKGFGLPLEQEKRILNRIDYAEQRVEKPLSWFETFLFILIPFGHVLTNKLIHSFGRTSKDSHSIHLKEERRLGFQRRVLEYYIYSIVGICTYATIIVIASYI